MTDVSSQNPEAVLHIACVRSYDVRDVNEGAGHYRALVDALWPRGVAKKDLDFDEWAKDVAPSADLREGFHHGRLSFADFAARYREELAAHGRAEALAERARAAGARTLDLLYSARDTEHNNAVVLCDYLLAREEAPA